MNGLRFLLALWVAIGHYYIVIGSYKFLHVPVLTKILSTPRVAVDGFMMITGFLMAYNYFLREDKEPFHERSTGVKFLIRRFFRLYPVYFIAILGAYFLVEQMYLFRKDALIYFTGSSVLAGGTEAKIETRELGGLLTHLFGIHGLFPQYESSVLSVAWSLSLEMQFYVLFPFLFPLLFRRKQSPLLTLAIILLSSAASVVLSKLLLHSGQMPSMLLFKLPVFFLGMLLAAAGLGRIPWKLVGISAVIILPTQEILTILLLLIIMAFLFLDQIRRYIGNPLYRMADAFRKLLSNKLSEVGADLSYSFYLFHMILMPFLLHWIISFQLGSKYLTAGIAFAAFLIGSTLLAWVMFSLVEKRFIIIGKAASAAVGKQHQPHEVPIKADATP